MIKAVIFDFDGTLADSFNLFVESFVKIAPANTNKETSLDELRGLPTKEVLKKLNIKRRQIPLLVIRGKKEMSYGLPKLSTFKDLDKSLKDLFRNDIKLFVISSNNKQSIEGFMASNNISNIWEEIIGDIGLFGKAKSIKKLLRKTGLNHAEVVYIGDETRDVSAAKKAGVKSIAVSWGFNNKDVLASSKPDFLIQRPKDLLQYIARL